MPFDPIERRMLYESGWRHGAVGRAQRHLAQPDYLAGWRDGQRAKGAAVAAYCHANDLPMPSPLREVPDDR